MTLAWMAYLLIVSALAAGAALAAERALRLYRRPARWAWATGLFVSVGLPGLAWLLPRAFAAATPSLESGLTLPVLMVGSAGALEAIAAGSGSPAWVARAEALLPVLWGLSVCAAAAFVGVAAFRLRRERRAWSRETVDAEPVLLSENRGPAVVGLLSGTVVLPRWIAELEEEARRVVLLHEREHLRAGDHRLFAAGILAVLVAPWNPILWWQLRRLRLALECDCDARVLARGVDPAAYGVSLLLVGARRSRAPWRVAAFAEPRSFLRRRVETMTEKTSRLRGPKAAAAALAATGLLFLACEAVPPTEPGATIGETEVTSQPAIRPYDTPPRLENAPEVQAALEEVYPAALKEAGVGGTVVLWMYVDEDGRVTNTVVKEGSGHSELDEAAESVAATMSFTPALNEGSPTDVWVAQSISFDPSLTPQEALAYWDRPPEERPLVVIDGVIQADTRSLEELNALEIDKVEILKGAAAEESYGARGRNGVIQITTMEAAERR